MSADTRQAFEDWWDDPQPDGPKPDAPVSKATAEWIWQAATTAAQSEIARLQAEVEGLRKALGELVACKDLKDRLHDLHERGHGTDYDDYYRRKPIAWAAARAALAAPKETN